jgi:hypothetical protein
MEGIRASTTGWANKVMVGHIIILLQSLLQYLGDVQTILLFSI